VKFKSGRNQKTTHTRRGFTLVEFLVASTIALMVLTASALALTGAERSIVTARARDVAASVAFGVLEQANVFKCQLAPDPLHQSTQDTAIRCATMPDLDVNPDLDPDYTAGDFDFVHVDENGRNFNVTYHSTWIDNTGSPCPSSTAEYIQPLMLRRNVTVTWNVNETEFVETFSSFQALPDTALFRSPSLGGIVVEDLGAETTVTLTGPLGSGTPLTRLSSSCDPSDPDSGHVVWFPYLPVLEPGQTYRISIDSGAGVDVFVNEGDVTFTS